MSAKKIVVTGGAGLIGRALSEYLLSLGHVVVILDDFSNSEQTCLNSNFIVHKIDLTKHEDTVAIIQQCKPDLIYHLACHPYEGLSQFNPYDVSMTTYTATINVLIGAIKAKSVKRFVNYSSMARYGKGHLSDSKQILGAPFKEHYTPNPEDVYAAAKVAAEKCVEILCDLHGIEWVNCVPHNVYGEANMMALSDPYRGFLLIWTNCLLRNKPFYIYGDGEQKRAPSYIGDRVKPMADLGFLASTVRQTVNIGALKEYTINEMATMIRKIYQEETGASSTPEPIYVPKRPCEVKNAWCSIEKSVHLLNYQDSTSLEEGIRKLIRWAREVAPNGVLPRYMKSLEIEDGAPETWTKKLI